MQGVPFCIIRSMSGWTLQFNCVRLGVLQIDGWAFTLRAIVYVNRPEIDAMRREM